MAAKITPIAINSRVDGSGVVVTASAPVMTKVHDAVRWLPLLSRNDVPESPDNPGVKLPSPVRLKPSVKPGPKGRLSYCVRTSR